MYQPSLAQTVVTATKSGNGLGYFIKVVVTIKDSDQNIAYFSSATLIAGQYSVNVIPTLEGPLLPSHLTTLGLVSDLLLSHDSMYDNLGVFYVNMFVSGAIQGYFPSLKLVSIDYE